MTADRPEWRVERHQELREDAERLFVPAEELAGATVGDAVIVIGADGHERHGALIELVRDHGTYAVVSFEQ